MDKLKDEKFAEFYKKFLSIIAPQYESLENERLSFLNKYRINCIKITLIVIFALLVFVTFAILSIYKNFYVYFIIASVVCFVSVLRFMSEIQDFILSKANMEKDLAKKFQKQLKNQFLFDLLKTFNQNITFDKNAITSADIRNSKLIMQFEESCVDDGYRMQ